MAFSVVYDACVLYPAPLRDFLIRTALTGVVQARWTEEILEECFRNILKNRPELSPARLERTRGLMRSVIPNSMVEGYEELIDGLALPDPDDRHVLAAAIHAGAQSIVTFNLRDFPEEVLSQYGVEAVHPDEFALGLIELSSFRLANVVHEQAAALKNPSLSVPDVLDMLRAQGLIQAVARLNEIIG